MKGTGPDMESSEHSGDTQKQVAAAKKDTDHNGNIQSQPEQSRLHKMWHTYVAFHHRQREVRRRFRREHPALALLSAFIAGVITGGYIGIFWFIFELPLIKV